MAEIRTLNGYAGLTDLPCLELSIGESKVIVSSYGAHVLAYKVRGHDILWLSKTAVWQNAKAIRGGIPICWPWFGQCPQEISIDNTAKPNHGLVRTQFWNIENQLIADKQLCVTFELTNIKLPWTDELVSLQYHVELTDLALTVTLGCNHTVQQQAALHSYFTVGNCADSTVLPLPNKFYDKTIDGIGCTNSDTCFFTAEIDRIYQDTCESLKLISDERVINIYQSGHDASVVWNPGHDKALLSTDIAPNSWQNFVCVESAKLNTAAAPLNLSQKILNPFSSHIS